MSGCPGCPDAGMSGCWDVRMSGRGGKSARDLKGDKTMLRKIRDYIMKQYTGCFKGYDDICYDIYRHFKKDTHYFGDDEFQAFVEWMRSEQRVFDIAHTQCFVIKDLLIIPGEESTGDCLFDKEKVEELMIYLVYTSILDSAYVVA